MLYKQIEIKADEYLSTYTDTAYIIAENRAIGNKLLLIKPTDDCSHNKFTSYLKKALLELKRVGKISVYLTFGELFLDKTKSKYILSFYPTLKEEVSEEEFGFIVKL